MPNLTTVGLVGGIPTSGTGNVSTIDNMLGTAGTPSLQVLSVQGITSATPIVATGTVSVANVNANGRTIPGNSAPVVLASQKYVTVPASTSGQALVGTGSGAAGDWLDGILVVPSSLTAGAVSISDGTGSAISVFAGGATSVTNLVSFFIPIGAISASGAWKMTTGANVTCLAMGNFS